MSAIARNWRWFVAALAVAGIVHAASLYLLPRLIMARTMAGIERGRGVNQMRHGRRPSADSRGVVRPSPDLFYSSCVFDLDQAGGAVRVRARGMPRTYWSVSAFASNSDNFFVTNDRKQGSDSVDFLIIARGAFVDGTHLPVVVAPTNRGIVLFRTLINDETHVAEIDAARRNASCAPYGK